MTIDLDAARQRVERDLDRVTRLLEDIRGEPAPAVRLDPKADGVAGTGNAHVQYDLGALGQGRGHDRRTS